jgi:hypothetical protein
LGEENIIIHQMRSSCGNAPLRMTQDDSIFGLQDRPSCCFAAPSEDENTDSRIYVSRYPKEDEK